MAYSKQEKAEYDRKYRERKKEELRIKKQAYCQSPAGRAMQKRNRDKRKQQHNEYCRKPDQRAKEKHRRHKREGKLKLKYCIVCDLSKPIIEFAAWDICKDGRSYLCKECEKKHKTEYGCSTKNVITAMVMRPYSNLTRKDIVEYPYLVEANKFLILLKKLTK